MRLSREIALHSSDLDLESFLSLLLRYRADAQADSNSPIPLVDESSAICEDRDAWCASCGHELLLWGGGAFSKGTGDWATCGANETVIVLQCLIRRQWLIRS